MLTEYPKVVVFDLDYTLWPFWCDTHVYMPIKAINKHEAIDRLGTKLSLFPDVGSIVKELHQNGVTLVAASRTATPRVAQELLSTFHVDDQPIIKYFLSLQWGQGSKIHHIRRAAKQLNLEAELEEGEFILFDDEGRNRDVEKINCKFEYLINERLDREDFERGIRAWASWKKERKQSGV